jgi:hypothetical protein
MLKDRSIYDAEFTVFHGNTEIGPFPIGDEILGMDLKHLIDALKLQGSLDLCESSNSEDVVYKFIPRVQYEKSLVYFYLWFDYISHTYTYNVRQVLERLDTEQKLLLDKESEIPE